METRWYVVEEESGHVRPLPFTKFHPAVRSKLPKRRPEHEELGDNCTVLAAIDEKAFEFLVSPGSSGVISALLLAGIEAGHNKALLQQEKESRNAVV